MQEVCVVIPCYNEARRLPGDAFLAFLQASPHADICFVDDGSSDGTATLLRDLQARQPDRIHLRRLEVNSGKAAAVRAGVLHVASLARFPLIGYWDADLSTPLEEVEHLLAVLKSNPRCRVALGSRVKRLGSTIERRAVRHVLGRIFAACASGVLGVAVYDSQCGAKIFRSESVPTLFGDPFLTRWLFDLEMLARLRNQVGTSIVETTIEVPLHAWREVGGSKLRPRDLINVPRELAMIRRYYKRS
jgi:glycosyltransferase involved in cell wall biosynthesis